MFVYGEDMGEGQTGTNLKGKIKGGCARKDMASPTKILAVRTRHAILPPLISPKTYGYVPQSLVRLARDLRVCLFVSNIKMRFKGIYVME